MVHTRRRHKRSRSVRSRSVRSRSVRSRSVRSRSVRSRKQSGGFRYGPGKKHTPSPGDVLINSPRTKKYSNKNKNSWF